MGRLFDPVSILNADLSAGETRRQPLPEGEVIAQVTKLTFNNGEKNGEPWHRLNINLEITDPEYLSRVAGSPDKAFANLGIMLEMNGNLPAMGPNKNIRLNRFRDACGVNGKPLAAMMGQMVRISIINKPHPTEPDQTLDDVAGFAAP